MSVALVRANQPNSGPFASVGGRLEATVNVRYWRKADIANVTKLAGSPS